MTQNVLYPTEDFHFVFILLRQKHFKPDYAGNDVTVLSVYIALQSKFCNGSFKLVLKPVT